MLVVDDDADIRETLRLVLEDEGYVVSSAANGVEALELLRRERPCLILLDLMMPVMNGWDFRARQREDPALADIPVVVISAGENPSALADAKAFIRKPVRLNDLLDTIERYC